MHVLIHYSKKPLFVSGLIKGVVQFNGGFSFESIFCCKGRGTETEGKASSVQMQPACHHAGSSLAHRHIRWCQSTLHLGAR